MPFSLVATMPLKTYKGHRPDGTAEPFPSVARLHAALLSAAGFGTRAVERDGDIEPCAEDVAALRWLEDNPPSKMSIPALSASRGTAIAYRADGTIGKTGKAKTLRKLPKRDVTVAVDGAFVWTWDEPPPAGVAQALRALCPDVAHLGTAESPVLLTTTEDDVAPTHTLAPGAGSFDRAPGHSLDVPVRGRFEELTEAHRATRTGKVGSDRAGTDERSLAPIPTRRALRTARYRQLQRPVADVPWSEVLLVPVDRAVAERDRVRWAVATHKALIKFLDRSSPPLLTGAYPPEQRRPANRVALQFLPDCRAVRTPHDSAALAVLLPADADPAQLDPIYTAVGRLTSVHSRSRDSRGRPIGPSETCRATGPVEVLTGDRFWKDPDAGTVRLWRTDPAAVPDTRGHEGWSFLHAALLSLGFVWQKRAGLPAPTGRGRQRYTALVEAVNAAGVAVVSARALRTSRVADYVHHVNPDAVVRPYRAELTVGDLASATTMQAIGQTRHLGGGLLVPHDLPEGATTDGAEA
ncbi:type I-G CRISPR-associated protein Csb2 [Pseudonocardia sp.]|uniref:type I-G CRISPR-associated protein Csb2 n=1 Tax=Pseudonocardia sp. TaxID=60912 RepID=UPI003D09E797